MWYFEEENEIAYVIYRIKKRRNWINLRIKKR